ncbi:MAG: VOC family protein [Candidatus Eremiobacteraeota bacterium]|nr:VOC family protein [Candidatus Eremiobacteraeota bacterium]MBV8435266.1 VOC family protein [Candidatus Eremiobacteraeota bacterium]
MTTTGSATQTGTTGTALTFQPYIFFYGRCKDALEFYKDVFGGTYEAMRVGDSPMKGDASMGSDDRIMHASFTSPGVNFLCSDGRDDKDVDPEEGNTALALSATDKAEGERIVAALSEGGEVKMPLADAFWGGRFADVVDKFGNEWMITLP